jgi:hypothetical protein
VVVVVVVTGVAAVVAVVVGIAEVVEVVVVVVVGTEVEGTGIDQAGCRSVNPTRVAGAGPLGSKQSRLISLDQDQKWGVIVGPR